MILNSDLFSSAVHARVAAAGASQRGWPPWPRWPSSAAGSAAWRRPRAAALAGEAARSEEEEGRPGCGAGAPLPQQPEAVAVGAEAAGGSGAAAEVEGALAAVAVMVDKGFRMTKNLMKIKSYQSVKLQICSCKLRDDPEVRC